MRPSARAAGFQNCSPQERQVGPSVSLPHSSHFHSGSLPVCTIVPFLNPVTCNTPQVQIGQVYSPRSMKDSVLHLWHFTLKYTTLSNLGESLDEFVGSGIVGFLSVYMGHH